MRDTNNNILHTANGIPVKLRKNLGLGYIIASFFFLFNPDITVIDVLPDALGYLLICAGLTQLSFINPSLEEAGEKFKKMIFVSLGKFVAVFLLFGLFNERERPYGFLLFTFSFLVLDLIFLLPAVKSLFEGLIYLAGQHKSEVAYRRKPAKDILSKRNIDHLPKKKQEKLIFRQERINRRAARRKTYIERIYRYTIVFFVIKAIGYVLPEFTVLTKDEYIDGSFIMYMYENIGKYRILAFLIVLILGIIWLCRSAAFFAGICKEKDFVDKLKGDFLGKILPREGLFVKRAIKNALIMFGAGAIFGIDFHVSVTFDNIASAGITLSKITLNIIPDVISAAFFLAGAIILRNYITNHKKLLVSSSVYMGCSFAASVLKVYFLVAYGSFSAIDHVYDAYTLFYTVCAATVVENIAFLVTILMFAFLMIELVKKYTGYIPSNPDHTTKGLLDSMHKELCVKIWVAVAFAILSAAFAPVYDFMLVERHFFAQISWVLDFAFQAAFAGFAVHALFEINDEVNSRYMLS